MFRVQGSTDTLAPADDMSGCCSKQRQDRDAEATSKGM